MPTGRALPPQACLRLDYRKEGGKGRCREGRRENLTLSPAWRLISIALLVVSSPAASSMHLIL
jgi:hypothetical protein